MISKEEIEKMIDNRAERDFRFLVYVMAAQQEERKKLEKRVEILEKQLKEMKK